MAQFARCSRLAMLLLVATATGARRNEVDGDLDPALVARTALVETEGLICGSDKIGELINKDTSFEGMRTTRWKTIKVIADTFMHDTSIRIEGLQAQANNLKSEIAEAQRREEAKEATAEQLGNLVISSIQPESCYGGVERASKSKCGADREASRGMKPVVSVSAFTKSEVEFKARAAKMFTGGLRTDAAQLLRVCHGMLPGDPPGSGKVDSFCDELCEEFGAAVQKLSDETAGVMFAESSILQRELQSVNEDIKGALADQQACQGDKARLEKYEASVTEIDKELVKDHEEIRKAMEALDAAQTKALELSEALQKQEVEAQKAVSIASAKSAEADEMHQSVNKLQTQQLALSTELKDFETRLGDAKDALSKATRVGQVVQGLKKKVAETLHQMDLYYDKAIRVPLRKLGVGEEQNIDAFFSEEPAQLSSAEDTHSSMAALYAFCEQKAMPVFQKVQDVDLTPLCKLGDQAINVAGIDQSVNDFMLLINNGLKKLQSYLTFTVVRSSVKESEVKLADEWEPKGLEVAQGGFGLTSYYRNYLSNWHFEASFQNLYNKLEESLTAADGTSKELEEKVASLKLRFKEAQDQREKAIASMRNADEQQATTEQERASLVSALDELRKQAHLQGGQSDDLLKALEEAQLRFRKARERLTDAHKQFAGGSLLQFLEHVEAIA